MHRKLKTSSDQQKDHSITGGGQDIVDHNATKARQDSAMYHNLYADMGAYSKKSIEMNQDLSKELGHELAHASLLENGLVDAEQK